MLPRYQRREPVINEALKQVFLLGVSTRQAGRALAGLVEEAVSASTVSAVAKVLDETVHPWHRRRLTDHYRYLLLDGVSVRIRLVGAVQRRMVLCAYGIALDGRRELIDFQIVKAEGEDTWYAFLWNLWSRGLRGEHLELLVTDGQAGWARAIGRLWNSTPHQRCWAHKLRNLENKLKASQSDCLDQAKLIYQAAHRTEAIGDSGPGANGGGGKLRRRWPAWRKTWKNSWRSLTARGRTGNDCARPMSSSDCLWKCVGASGRCAPLPPAAVASASSSASLTA